MKSLLSAVIISGGSGGFIHAILFLVIAAIILGIVLWLISLAPFIPAPFKTVLTWVVYLFAALILINFLLGLTGHPLFVLD